ncbi:phosphotransferase [Kribbella hippodromi]|uniref:Phosphotransferase n=1 Tax=Kribbella hippodromi TaxID=434347 RepID=A0ABN2CX58_9ACTN
MLDPITLATQHLGPITHAEPVDGFAGNQTHRLHTPTGTYYLKHTTTAPAEAHACNLAHSVNVPAPQVVAVTSTYLITEALAGEPLPPAHLSPLREVSVPGRSRASGERPVGFASSSPLHSAPVFREAGACMRRVHQLVEPSADWQATLSTAVDNLTVLHEPEIRVHLSLPPDELIVRAREHLLPFIDSVADVTPVLLHGDLHPRHLYATDGHLTGILDWGDTTYGDPLFDLARFSMAGPRATADFLAGYGPTDVPPHTLSCYRMLWSLMALQAEHAAGGDWFHPHVATITYELS